MYFSYDVSVNGSYHRFIEASTSRLRRCQILDIVATPLYVPVASCDVTYRDKSSSEVRGVISRKRILNLYVEFGIVVSLIRVPEQSEVMKSCCCIILRIIVDLLIILPGKIEEISTGYICWIRDNLSSTGHCAKSV